MAHLDEDVGAQLAAFAVEVRRLRELLGTHERQVARPELTEFANLDIDEQTRLIRSQLLGLGALPLDEAVSAAAQALRDDGYVRYQRLRRDGALYLLLDDRISRAARTGHLFDRPRPGHVRAIQPELDDFQREDWLDCLVNAVPAGKVLDRSTAQRLLFDYAREVWGLSAQRLRSGGKAERALKSTLNSAVRRGLLRRVGAAYLERVTPGTIAPPVEGASVAEKSDASRPDGSLAHAKADAGSESGRDDVDGDALASDGCDRLEPRLPLLGVANPTGVVSGKSNPDQAEPPWGELEAQAAANMPPVVSMAEQPDGSVSVLPSLPLNPDAPERDAPLQRPLLELPIPIRALNWAERNGLRVLRDLVAWHPDAFANERYVGRLTVAETRVVVEGALGREWEEVWGELDEPKTPPPSTLASESESSVDPLPAPEQSRWNRRGAELAAEHLELALSRLDLPARMRSYCEHQGLTTVGELLAVPRDELLAQPNLGRASLVQTLEALDSLLDELKQPAHDETLLSGWRRLLQRLPALQRMNPAAPFRHVWATRNLGEPGRNARADARAGATD